VNGFPQRLAAAALAAALAALGTPGCSSSNLGQLDETRSERDDMRGPGIFTDASGQTVLRWNSEGEPQAGDTGQSPTPAASQAEFEQFKKWDRLRTEGRDSAEYREFLLWLEYQQFKAAQ